MSYARILSVIGLMLLTSGATGCGMFGEKPQQKNLMGMGDKGAGCLNELDTIINRYVAGELEERVAHESFDCLIDTMGMFLRFVKGSADNGNSYTIEDIRALISTFLVTDREIPLSLIVAAFHFKASMFGGGAETITAEEFEKITRMVRVVKTETIRLLPNIREYHKNRSYKTLLGFADAIVVAARNFEGAFDFEGNLPMPKEQARALVNDISRLFGWKFPATLVDFGYAGKVAMLGGSLNEIENWAWRKLFHMGGSFGGVILGLFSIDLYPKRDTAEAFRYLISLAERAESALHEAIDYHGGAISIIDIERTIDTMPEDWLFMSRESMKSSLRPTVNKLFRSRLRDRIEHRSVSEIFALMRNVGRSQAHIESIFQRSRAGPDGLTRSEFRFAADVYEATLQDPAERAEVARLRQLVQSYKPLYWRDELRVFFGDLETYSLRYLTILSLADYGLKHLIESYSRGRDKLTLAQFKEFFLDFSDVLDSLGVFKKHEYETFAKSRFLELDIFTDASNGDSLMDRSEAIYFVLNVISFSTLIPDIESDLGEICRLGPQEEGERPILDPECFKREVAARSETYFSHFPYLLRLFRGLSPRLRLELVGHLMAAGKEKTSTPEQFTPGDLNGFAGFLHFAEGIFQRVDLNKDDVITLREVKGIFPVYRGLLFEMVSKFGLPSFLAGDGILLGAFAYVLRFAKVPAGVFDVPHMVLWLVGTEANWIVNSDRFVVIKALSNMAKML